MRTFRWLDIKGDHGNAGVERVLELDVTWQELIAIANVDGYGPRHQAGVLELCRRFFPATTMALVEQYIAQHPTKLPLFRPIAKVILGARPRVPIIRLVDLEGLYR